MRGVVRHRGGSAASGRLTKNVEPTPGVLSTQIRPPWAWAIFWQMASPAPVPSYSSRVWSRRKSSKIRAWNLGSIPIPLSRTAIVVKPPSALSGAGVDPLDLHAGRSERLYFRPLPIRLREELADPDGVAPDLGQLADDLDLGARLRSSSPKSAPDQVDRPAPV